LISIVIPTLNESERIVETLQALQGTRQSGHEVILVDGGSTDDTCEIARPWVDRVSVGSAGRALQLNVGAAEASGDTVMFLHADTLVPPETMAAFLAGFPSSRRAWGWFDVGLSGGHLMLRVVETLMNARSRWTGITTGDHAIFVRRETFFRVGGFPEIPLMEDVAISRLLKREARPFIPEGRIITSSRRWEERGVLRTILLMWRLRLAFALGADPGRLARAYYAEKPGAPAA
jgi:rSAM/selenodomain-associated transferase 2